MLAPLVLRSSPRSRPPIEQAAVPPTYFPHALSLDSYVELWNYQAGLPTYLFNSAATAFLTIPSASALTIPAGYALARFPIPGKEVLLRLPAPRADHPLPGAAHAALLHVRDAEADQHRWSASPSSTPRSSIPFSVYIMRNSFEAVPRELEEAAVIDGCSAGRC